MVPKSKICRDWLQEKCTNGEQCGYAHQKDEAPSIAKSTKRPKKVSMMEDHGKELMSFDSDALDDSYGIPIGIVNYKFLASYNWLDAVKATILVPGCPPRWNPPTLPVQVPKDSGRSFIDQNSYRRPRSPYAPFFQCLLTLQPNLDMTTICVITDRNSLRKLLAFASVNARDPFRIDVEMVGDTMVLIRREKSNVQHIRKDDDQGYGHEFEKAFSTFDKDLRGSRSHHRIVQYDLGAMKCLLRFEADAYVYGDEPSETDKKHLDDTYGLDEWLSTTLKPLVLGNDGQKPRTSNQESHEVRVIERGRFVPPASIAEAKSKKRGKNLSMKEVTSQMWFSQTEHLITGYHVEGNFEEVKHVDMLPRFEEWETKHQSQLKKLLSLMSKIKQAAQGTKDGRCVVIWSGKKEPFKLKIYEVNGDNFVVSNEMREIFWVKNTAQD